jgi:hypothetical protein
MRGRLNLFQRMMLRWRDLHPYSGVHVVRVRAALAERRLAGEIARRLEGRGLTGLELDPKRRWFSYRGGPADVALAVLPATPDPVGQVCGEVERQLNLAFPRAPVANPFRFFAVAAGDSFYLGLAYDHFIASGDSIALLVKEIADGYAGEASAAPCGPAPALYPATYRRLVLRNPAAFLKGLARLPGLLASSRRSFRPRYARLDDLGNGFAYFRVGAAELASLRGAARAWGVTLNDVFLAGLLRALSPFAAGRREAPRRRELAVASIVNVREDFGADPRRVFGQFLASFRVAHPVPEGAGLRELAQAVHAETARIKRDKLYLQTILTLGLSALMWPFLSVPRRRGFFAKYYPAWGGLTTLNVDALWGRNGPDGGQSLDYLRAGSTGPVCPLVFAVTTARAALHVGVSYRTAAFTRASVDALAEEFRRCIVDIEETVACEAP